MTQSKLAQFAYWLGCVSAVAALVFRSLFFFTELSTRLYHSIGVQPSGLLQFGVLCLVFSIASRRE